MLNTTLALFYDRDIRKLIDEVRLFQNEGDLWKIQGSIHNSSGNLVLHIIGGLNHFFGAVLRKNGYIRDRNLEFSLKGVERKSLIADLEKLIPLVTETLHGLSPEKMNADFPIMFDDANRSTSYVVLQLSLHLNYHIGQVNYLRRILE